MDFKPTQIGMYFYPYWHLPFSSIFVLCHSFLPNFEPKKKKKKKKIRDLWVLFSSVKSYMGITCWILELFTIKRIIKNIKQLFNWIEKYLITFTNLSIQLSFIIWLHASKFDFIFCLALNQLLPKQLILSKNVIFQNQLFLI